MRTTKHDTDPMTIPLIRAIEMISKAGHVHMATVRRRIEIGAYPLTMIKTNKRIVHVNAAHAKIIAAQEREKLIAELKGSVDVEAITKEGEDATTTKRDEWEACARAFAKAQTPFEKINARAMFDRLCLQNSQPTAPASFAPEPTPRPSADLGSRQTGRDQSRGRQSPRPAELSSGRGFTFAPRTVELGASS